jgi:hypothetical protein
MTVTTQRTRLDALREQEASLAEQADQLLEKINTYPARIKAAREEAIFSKPNKRPLATLNSPLHRLLEAEKKDVVTHNGLQADLTAIRNVLAQEDAKVRDQEKIAARAQTQELRAREEAIWKQAGSVLEQLATCFNEYAEQVEEAHRFTSSHGLERSEALSVVPGVDSFKAFVDLLVTAALSDEVRAPDYEQPLIDSGVFRGDHGTNVYDVRPAGSKQVSVRKKLDERDILFHAVPALGGIVRKLRSE